MNQHDSLSNGDGIADAVRLLADKIDRIVDAWHADRATGTGLPGPPSPIQPQNDESQRRLRRLCDELRELEAECADLRGQNDRLLTENAHLEAAAAESRRIVATMEATRGWRLLLRLRRWRNALLGRN